SVACRGRTLPGRDLFGGLAAVVAPEGHRTGVLIGLVLHRDIQHRVRGHASWGHGGHHVPTLLGWFGLGGDDLHLRGRIGRAFTLHGAGHGEGAFLGVLRRAHLLPAARPPLAPA